MVLTLYDIKKLIITHFRDELVLNPISLGSVSINHIYREYDSKPNVENYLDISFLEGVANFNHGCTDRELIIMVDCYSTNEIMTDRIANEFITKFQNIYIQNPLWIGSFFLDRGIVELSKNKFVQRVTFKMVI